MPCKMLISRNIGFRCFKLHLLVCFIFQN